MRPFLLLLLAGGVAHAEPARHDEPHGAGDAVTFVDALRAAVTAPDVAAGQRAGRVWRRHVATAGGAPALRAQLAPGFGDDGRALQLELAAALTPGRRAVAGRAATADAAALEAHVAVTRRDRLAGAAAAWLAAWAARAQLALADEELARARELVELAERGRALGVTTRVEQTAAAAYLVELQLRHLEIEGHVTDAELALAAAVGHAAPRPLVAAGPLPAVELDGPLVSAAARAGHAAAAAARQRAAAATGAQRHQLEVGVRGELTGDVRAAYLLLGVALPGGDRGGLEAAAARAHAAVLEGEALAYARLDGVAQARARHDVEHTGRLVELRGRRVEALVAQVAALDAARAGGEALVPELIQARRQLVGGRAELVDALALAAGARVERALAAGWEGP